MSKITQFLSSVQSYIFRHPRMYLSAIALATIFFAMQIPALKLYSEFADLLPQKHPYIQLHNQIKDNFGGANKIVVGIEVKDGDIFTNDTLARIHRITQKVDTLPGINHNLVASLTHRNCRKIWLTEVGNIDSKAYYDPEKTNLSKEELDQMRADIAANPTIYGPLVSPDMKIALVKAQLNEGQLDYEKTFAQLQAIRKAEAHDGVIIYATGQPVLIGWAYTYKVQLYKIFFFTLLIMIALLTYHFRKAYGILIPLGGVIVSATWGLGIISLFGYNLDPLGLVIPFLISARAMSHGVQLVERYYIELEHYDNTTLAARHTFESLFRPGALGVVCDSIGLGLIAVGSIPFNTKLSHYATLWAISILFTVLIAVPALLSTLPKPKDIKLKENALRLIGNGCAKMVSGQAAPKIILIISGIISVVGLYCCSLVTIGESEPGSPILYRNHDYNISSKVINDRFPGSEELYLVAETTDKHGLKRPEVLRALEDLERHMMTDPEVGGAKGLPDLVKNLNRLLHNCDPRWYQIPLDATYTGGLLFTFMASSPIPGALNEFADTDERVANLVFFYKDHQGETIRRGIYMAKQWVDENKGKVEGLTVRLAGGTIGVIASMNEEAFNSNLLTLPLVFLFIWAAVCIGYMSFHSGFMMFMAMTYATVLTYAYMGLAKLGINVNTVPVIAVGVGVGIDYSIYMLDRIREEMVILKDLRKAVARAISTTGLAISFTALTLISGIVMWIVLSDLRFQADAAMLLSVMVVLNAMAALILVPAWTLAFEPKFIMDAAKKNVESYHSNLAGAFNQNLVMFPKS
jgi:uncharacterized protein